MHVFVRFIHVASVTYILGGALLLFALFVVAHLQDDPAWDRTLLRLLSVYEYGFWFAIGVIVMTGIGNVGAFGRDLPAAASTWGERFTVKLTLVLVLLALSLVRTFSLTFMLLAAPVSRATRRALEGLYGASAVIVASVLGLAVVLAHA